MKNYDRYNKFVEQWKNYTFPARPSPEELIIFNDLMANNKGKKLLILGSTPEFRDLGARNNLKVTCADINSNMYNAMKKIMSEVNKSEGFVECSWFDMPLKTSSFDLIFAEQSMNIVDTEKFGDFLNETRRVLKPEGIFVLKTLHHHEFSKDNIVKLFKEQDKPVEFLYDQFLNMKENYKDGKVGHAILNDIFPDLLKEKVISQEQHDSYFEKWSGIIEGDLKLNATDKESMENIISKYFIIEKIVYGDDFEKHRLHPIYILKKKLKK